MNVKHFISISLIGGAVVIGGASLGFTSISPEVIQDSAIKLDLARTTATPVSKLLEEDSPVLVNATSQLQLLHEERSTLETEIQDLQTRVKELRTQRNILAEETSPYAESISKDILTPLTHLKDKTAKYENKQASSSLYETTLSAITQAITCVEQYLHNPNNKDEYETTLQTTFEFIDDELTKHPVNSALNVASEFLTSGFTKTMILLDLNETQELLQAFEANYITVENDETAQFKRSKQQQLATEEDLKYKKLQLDELALRLSGILDEIEQVSQ